MNFTRINPTYIHTRLSKGSVAEWCMNELCRSLKGSPPPKKDLNTSKGSIGRKEKLRWNPGWWWW